LPSDRPVRRLEDIVENAQAIERYVAGMDAGAAVPVTISVGGAASNTVTMAVR
jgi:hypothetical protein